MGRAWWDVYTVCFWGQWQPGSWSSSGGDKKSESTQNQMQRALLWDSIPFSHQRVGPLSSLLVGRRIRWPHFPFNTSIHFVPRCPLGSNSGSESGWGWASSTASSSPSSSLPSSSASEPTRIWGAKSVIQHISLLCESKRTIKSTYIAVCEFGGKLDISYIGLLHF